MASIAGAVYRSELLVRYLADVCDIGSVKDMNITPADFDSGLLKCLEGDKAGRRNFCAWCGIPVLFGVDASAIGFMGFWLALILSSIFLPLIWTFGFIGLLRIRRLFSMERHYRLD